MASNPINHLRTSSQARIERGLRIESRILRLAAFHPSAPGEAESSAKPRAAPDTGGGFASLLSQGGAGFDGRKRFAPDTDGDLASLLSRGPGGMPLRSDESGKANAAYEAYILHPVSA